MSELVKKAEELIKYADELISLAQGRGGRGGRDRLTEVEKELEEVPVLPTERLLRPSPEEAVIRVTGRIGELLNKILTRLDEVQAELRKLEADRKHLRKVAEGAIGKLVGIRKEEIDVDELFEQLARDEETDKGIERLIVVTREKVARISARVRQVFKAEEFIRQVEPKLREVFEASEEQINAFLDFVRSFYDATKYMAFEIKDLTEEMRRRLEEYEARAEGERRESIKVAQTFFERIVNWINRAVSKVIDVISRWVGLKEEAEEVIEDFNETLDEIEGALEVVPTE